MADICILYARQDEGVAEKLYTILSKRWSVWWDRDIVGSFADAIEQEIPQSACVVPVWSAPSRSNANVGDELRLARRLGKPLIPVRVDGSDPPYGYGDLSYVDLNGWCGRPEHPGIQQLTRRIAIAVPPRSKPTRPETVAGGRLKLPAVFLSVSSYETRLRPLDAVRALRLYGADALLISAYDLAPGRRQAKVAAELAQFRDLGGFVLADSGNYEATRIGDRSWRPGRLGQALAEIPLDWACSFDVMNVPADPAAAVDRFVKAAERDRQVTDGELIPIVHARQIGRGHYNHAALPEMIRAVAERLAPPMIAVPERELGAGLLERARTVRHIRSALDTLPCYQPLHLLGTGNPWSIAVLTAAGADSFDGLEWCRVAINAETGMLHHFQHFDFFAWQAKAALSAVTQAAVADPKVDYAGKVAFHNIEYFNAFCRKLQDHAMSHRMEVFITATLGPQVARELALQMPELFA